MSKALYYDGKSPLPTEGVISLTRRGVEFHSKELLIRVSFSKIRGLDGFKGEYHIGLRDNRYTSRKIVYFDEQLRGAIEEGFLKQSHPFVRIAHRMHHYPLAKVLAIVLLTVPTASFLFFTGFTSLYKIVPESYDRRLGERSYDYLVDLYGRCEDDRSDRILARMVKGLTDAENIRVSLVYSEDVNALAFPGGGIVIFSGLLNAAESPEELYAVLAHEVAHVEKRHSIQQLFRMMGLSFIMATIVGGTLDGVEQMENMSEILNLVLYMKYSRGFEEEADRIAIEKMVSKRVSLKGFDDFFKRNSATVVAEDGEESGVMNWLNSHPADDERMARIAEAIGKNRYKPVRVLNQTDWKRLKRACAID